MIKTIFFDFDGVLTTDGSGSQTTCRNLHRSLPHTTYEHILACYRQHHAEMLIGQLTHQDIWEQFCACVGQDLDIAVLMDAFRNTPPNEPILNICARLKDRYRLGVITDNSRDRFAVVKAEMQLSQWFSLFVVSGELGTRKDSHANFEQALKLAQAQAEECLFIDNNAANLIIPGEMGIKTIYHDHQKNDVEKLVNALEGFGVFI